VTLSEYDISESGAGLVAKNKQLVLFDVAGAGPEANTSTFIDNMKMPVHRWFRYSAGFSAQWAESVIADERATRVFDPFAGSGTTLVVAEDVGRQSYGVESHPFVARIARAKLARRSSPESYREMARAVLRSARRKEGSIEDYPALIRKCYRDEALRDLDSLRSAVRECQDDSSASELVWLTLVSILRMTSHVGTANWQYVLPKKTKKNVLDPLAAFERQAEMVYGDMLGSQSTEGPSAKLVEGDARTCEAVPSGFADCVITSPPYPNNFDYADATRLEMTFMREIDGWGDLQETVRKHLVRSCSQHVPERTVDLDGVLNAPQLSPIRREITTVCEQLASIRLTKGGKKTYHLMVACYFLDLAKTWHALRRVCDSPSKVCFVVGDSAPYGVHVPVPDWLGRLAVAAGFHEFGFERIRDRNTKWKNRKHRVPLCEGRLWVQG
jgi:hypothetical protein